MGWKESRAEEEILAEEREKKEKRTLRRFGENLRSFIISIESMLQTTHTFLTAEDILQGSSSKDFAIHIFKDDKVRWTLSLRFSNEGKRQGSWPLFGAVVNQSFPVGYDLVVECSFQGGKLFEPVIQKDTVTSVCSPIIISPRIEDMVREHSGFEMINTKIFTIFDLRKEICDFFRQVLFSKYGDQTVEHVFAVAQKFYYLAIQGCHTYRQFIANHGAVQSFQVLVFETARELRETKSFVKSKKLAHIREELDNRSRIILAELNK